MTVKKKSDYIIVMFFLIFIYGIAFANIFTKDRSYSEAEKRMLAQKPEFRVADIVSGKYMEDFETYIANLAANAPNDPIEGDEFAYYWDWGQIIGDYYPDSGTLDVFLTAQ